MLAPILPRRRLRRCASRCGPTQIRNSFRNMKLLGRITAMSFYSSRRLWFFRGFYNHFAFPRQREYAA